MPTHKVPLSPLSLNQLSEITGQTYRTIKKKLQGLEPEEKDGRTLLYNTIDALHLIFEVGGGADDDDDSPRKKIDGKYEFARLTKLRADHLEFDLEVKRGLYISKVEVETWLTNKILGFRSSLRNLAVTLSPEIFGKTEKQIAEILNRAHDEALSEMAIENDELIQGTQEEDPQEASSAAEAEDIEVG